MSTGRSGTDPRLTPRKRGSARIFLIAPCFVGALLVWTSCAPLGDPYPEKGAAKPRPLVREWKNGDTGATLDLRAKGKFTVKNLRAQYSSCSSRGLHTKSGEGTWKSLDVAGSTSVVLDFSDGCDTTLYFGEESGDPVLYNSAEGADIVMKLT